jgi:hypothetical protein
MVWRDKTTVYARRQRQREKAVRPSWLAGVRIVEQFILLVRQATASSCATTDRAGRIDRDGRLIRTSVERHT